jgi:CRISPR-associated protein Csm4
MKKTYNVIRLQDFKGGLHLARGLTNAYDKSLKMLHSDTLKSAIFSCALQLFSEIGEAGDDNGFKKGKAFLNDFKISSAFPFYKGSEQENPLYFFPKPDVLKLPFDIEGELGLEKKLKKVSFLERELFERLIKDNTETIVFKKHHLKGAFMVNNDEGLNFSGTGGILDNDDCSALTTSEPYQHVAIPRDQGSDSTPYYVDKIYFHQNAGLYFLVDTDDATFEKIKAAVKLLADNGIGTDRNGGNGQFDVVFDTMELDIPDDGNFDLSLSLYCPLREEIQQIDKSFYGLTKRGGYISSPQNEENLSIRKRSIHMFTEGSLFPKMKGRIGKVVDLKPDEKELAAKNIYINHPIWRDGQPIFIPMKYNIDGK